MDETLTVKLLPAALICKGFIANMPDCNYERYLLQIVNASGYFIKKSNGEVYLAPSEEAHGEYDCCSSRYEIDFKLIASETALRGRNQFSGSISKLAEGVTVYGPPKMSINDSRYKPINATQIFVALRFMKLDELRQVRNSGERAQGLNTDLRAFLETLETNKNILMFFPYEFFSEKKVEFDDEVVEIISVLSHDFNEALKYRKEVAVQYM